MKLSEYLRKENCVMSLNATTKEEAIKELVSALTPTGKIKDKEDFIKHILERERLGSTGIGARVAIPHAPTRSVDSLVVAFGRSVQGIDFQSLDGEEVNYIFLMGTNPSDIGLYLKALASLSRMLSDRYFKEEFSRAASPEEIIEVFSRFENNR